MSFRVTHWFLVGAFVGSVPAWLTLTKALGVLEYSSWAQVNTISAAWILNVVVGGWVVSVVAKKLNGFRNKTGVKT